MAVRRTVRGPRLVGRDREYAVLDGELDRAARGEWRGVLLTGEAGAGKTRLAAELVARRPDVTDLAARAFPLGSTTPFGLWGEALERHLRGLPPEDVARLCAGSEADLATLLRSVAAATGVRPDAAPSRPRLVAALTALMRALAAEHPVVLRLDDLHLADVSSLEALHAVAHGCADAAVLALATVRPAPLRAAAEVEQVLLALEQDGLLRRLPVGPLPDAALGDLAGAALGPGTPVPAALTGWLARRSGGNPFAALELLRALQAEGADLAAPELQELPDSLAARVELDLARVGPDAVALLELLAVLGRRTDLRSLVALAGAEPAALAARLETLVRADLVTEEERGLRLAYEPAHPLLAEVVYRRIGAARRRLLHRQVGRVLADAGRVGEAAPHVAASAGADDDEAVAVLLEAERRAEAAGAYPEALAVLGALVELLPAGDPRWRAVVDALRWDAEWVLDHRADEHALSGIGALRAMDAALAGVPDPEPRARVRFRLAGFLAWGEGDLGQARRLCREAGELFAAAGDRRGALLAAHEGAWIDHLAGAGAPALCDRAADLVTTARSEGDGVVLGRALRTVGLAALVCGRFEESRAALAEVVDSARAQGNAYRLAMALANQGQGLVLAGRVAEGLPLLEEAAAALPDDPPLPLEVFVRWLAGDHTGAVAAARRAAGSPVPARRHAWAFAPAAASAAELGEHAEAARYLALARRPYQGDHGTYGEVVAHAAALCAVLAGRGPDVVPELRRLAERSDELGILLVLPARVDLAEVAAAAGRPEPAAGAALDRVAERTGVPAHAGLAALASGWAALAAGDRRAAEEHARRAVGVLSAASWPVYLARARHLLGLATADRDRAAAELAAAAEGLAACGALVRRTAVLDALGRLGSHGRRVAAAARGPGSLTPREREVAELAAAGLTAREIGARLFIGERTVEGHLARAYARLGVRSRVELARYAADGGLAGSGTAARTGTPDRRPARS
ncbi:ATP-binding protein [Geodermatophilus sp. SYSU D00710]